MVRWCDGAGKLIVLGRHTNKDKSKAMANYAFSRYGWGVWTFSSRL